MKAHHWGLIALTALLFGSSFLFISIAVATVPPVTLAAIRAALAAVLVTAAMLGMGLRLPRPGIAWLPLVVLGLLTTAVPYFAIAWGQQHISSGLGGILFGTIPVFSILVAPLFLADERYSFLRIFGAGVAFTGVVVAIGPEELRSVSTQAWGAFATILAAWSYAAGNIFARRNQALSPVVLAAGQMIAGAVFLIVASMLFEQPHLISPSAAGLMSLIVVAVFNTAIPVLLMFWLVRNVGATNSSILTFFMPVVALVLGAIALKEPLSQSVTYGLAFILLGGMLVSGNLQTLLARLVKAGKS